MSGHARRQRSGRQRDISVRGVRRAQLDIRRFARAVIGIALAEVEREQSQGNSKPSGSTPTRKEPPR